MNRIGVTLRGTSPLHLNGDEEPRSSSSHRCRICDGRPTIDSLEVCAAMEAAAFRIADTSLRLMTAIFVSVEEPRIDIASQRLFFTAQYVAASSGPQLQSASMTFDVWELEFTLHIPREAGNRNHYRQLLAIAGTDVGLGQQLSNLRLGRFVIQRWNPWLRVAEGESVPAI